MSDNLQAQFEKANDYRVRALEKFHITHASGLAWYEHYTDGADFDNLTLHNLIEVFARCETPLEREFFGRTVMAFASRYPYGLVMGQGPKGLSARWQLACRRSIRIDLQYPVEVSGYRFRLDALVTNIATISADFSFDRSPLAVEVDGHTYHSDDAAFERDRRRDRQLQEGGYRVRRYSSREFFADKGGVTTEFAEFLFSGSGFSDGNNPFAGRRKELKDVLGIVRAAMREAPSSDGNGGMALPLAARKADRRRG